MLLELYKWSNGYSRITSLNSFSRDGPRERRGCCLCVGEVTCRLFGEVVSRVGLERNILFHPLT